MAEEAKENVQVEDSSKPRILVVDDSIFISSQMTRILNSGGYSVIGVAGDGETGFALYKQHYPNVDLVTLDITMPGMDGITALKKILSFDPKANVIMVTAISKEDLVKEALLTGAKNYIVKPITQTTVLDRVASVLAQAQKDKE